MFSMLTYLKECKIYWRWYFKKPKFPNNSDGKVWINVGCGQTNIPNFINIDARPLPHVHIVTNNLTKLHMLPNESADYIYMSHVLEHIKKQDVRKVLAETMRVLKVGGTLILAVPDFDKIIFLYYKSGKQIEKIERYLMGESSEAFNQHFLIFNERSLTFLLQEAGFKSITKWGCTTFNFGDWASKEHISLNLLGVK